MSAMEVDKSDAIDEALYSRQLYVLGHEAMRRMQQSILTRQQEEDLFIIICGQRSFAAFVGLLV